MENLLFDLKDLKLESVVKVGGLIIVKAATMNWTKAAGRKSCGIKDTSTRTKSRSRTTAMPTRRSSHFAYLCLISLNGRPQFLEEAR
jgi:hypothetical protein